MGADGRHGARREGHRHCRADLPFVAASCDNPPMPDPRIAPASVRAALRRGIDLYAAGRGGKGLVDDTVDWARALADGAKITYPKAVKMRGWFARHGPPEEEATRRLRDPQSPAAVAWLLWGGDPAIPYRARGWDDPVNAWVRGAIAFYEEHPTVDPGSVEPPRAVRRNGMASTSSMLREPPLVYYGLAGLSTGEPVTLYHGTTASFSRFDIAKSRDDLVGKFYGRGIFFTPRKSVAWKYANANRNMGLPVSVIDDLSRINRSAGAFLRVLYKHGQGAWEPYWKAHGFWRKKPAPGQGRVDSEGFERHLGGVDPNTLMDIAGHIVGTAKGRPSPNAAEEVFGLFSQSTGSPDWLYDDLDRLGLDSAKYRPKVLTVEIRARKPLVTADANEARTAHRRGYDSTVYYGPETVDSVPEVAIYDGRMARIVGVEVDQ